MPLNLHWNARTTFRYFLALSDVIFKETVTVSNCVDLQMLCLPPYLKQGVRILSKLLKIHDWETVSLQSSFGMVLIMHQSCDKRKDEKLVTQNSSFWAASFEACRLKYINQYTIDRACYVEWQAMRPGTLKGHQRAYSSIWCEVYNHSMK